MTDITGREYIYGIAQDKNGAPYLFNIGDLVRCKDCKHRYMDGEVTHYYWCRLHDRPVDDADYCAWSELKGGDDK